MALRDTEYIGATAYYLHTVLHDWPDARAVAILSHIAAAAEPNYSRILIHETVVTDIPSAPDTTSDLQMMMALSSFERTESAWRDILAATGLDVVKIWRAPGSAESIIEAIRREGSWFDGDIIVRPFNIARASHGGLDFWLAVGGNRADTETENGTV